MTIEVHRHVYIEKHSAYTDFLRTGSYLRLIYTFEWVIILSDSNLTDGTFADKEKYIE